jgi:PIN domain nuclease of toxin-antitoxin system
MRYLLDTCALIWVIENSDLLSEKAKETILSNDSEVFFSPISAWEIAIKSSLNKLTMNGGIAEAYRTLTSNGFLFLPVKWEHTQLLETMPWHHKDPFDRLLISTALVENLTLITSDSIIKAYGVEVLW